MCGETAGDMSPECSCMPVACLLCIVSVCDVLRHIVQLYKYSGG